VRCFCILFPQDPRALAAPKSRKSHETAWIAALLQNPRFQEICERYNVSRWQLDRTTNMILVAEDATAHIIPCCPATGAPTCRSAVVQIRGRFFVLGIEIDEHGHARYPPGADAERDQDNLLTWTAEWWVLRISPFGRFTDSNGNTHNPNFQQHLDLAIDELEDMLEGAVYKAQRRRKAPSSWLAGWWARMQPAPQPVEEAPQEQAPQLLLSQWSAAAAAAHQEAQREARRRMRAQSAARSCAHVAACGP
jgi:hypothetical protein